MGEQPTLRVVSLESRRADDMASLLRRRGLSPIVAPSMQEVPLSDQTDALAFGETLVAGDLDILVLLTGVGFRMLVDAIATRHARADVVAAVGAVRVACRGPKPVAVLKGMGLGADVVAPAPNTWRELLEALDAQLPVAGKRVVVQEYGSRNDALLDALRERGASVRAVPIYAWKMPDDTTALVSAIRDCCEGRAEAIVLTSQQQVHNLLSAAESVELRAPLLEALRRRMVVASIGPITTEALEGFGVRPDLEPDLGKMGHLVKLLAERGAQVLADKGP